MKRTVSIVAMCCFVIAAAWTAYAYSQGAGPLTWLCPGTRAQGMCATPHPSCGQSEQCHAGTACPSDGKDCPCFQDRDGDGKCDLHADAKAMAGKVGACNRHSANDCHSGASRSGCAGMHGTRECGHSGAP